uniref:Aldehyde oxidase n=1 Tax=Penaeus japonicus TaxID=27405 RepID=A0A336UZ51_PENJP|nr:aldehyde oxidase [Penaeus japonicus]BBC28100.1 aldehyde oxidase [Penaeus japonicus]
MAPQEHGFAGCQPKVGPGITFTVNDVSYTVDVDVPPSMRLVDFLRQRVKISGTKALCREGGCGVCTVVVTVPDPETAGRTKTYSVQACQTLVYACAGWSIETIEHLGNRFSGYHPLQTALHGFYGTQCGYCSPGMIITMYGQLQSGGSLTAEQGEESLDGDLCRCTGYRPILDAFKSLAVDGAQDLKDRLTDIEDAYKGMCKTTGKGCGGCKKDGKGCSKKAAESLPKVEKDLHFHFDNTHWFRPVSLNGLYSILNGLGRTDKVRIVVGNTEAGVFKNDGPYTAYISTSGIRELYSTRVGSPLEMGANVSLNRAIEIFEHMAASDQSYHHLQSLADHWKVVANVAVRNAGSWAGNLMLKHAHVGFQSDIFITLLMAGAELTLGHAHDGSPTHIDLEQFLQTDMSRSVILSVSLPPATVNTKVRTFKITPRAVNAHAYVNACFRMEVDPEDGFKVLNRPVILFGGINPQFIHASQTEDYLTGRRLTDSETVLEAAKLIGQEVKPDSHPHDASPAYRTALAQGLLFKAIVGFLGDKVPASIRSAGPNIERPLSSGKQSFDMNQESWPVGEPVPKLESAAQISGEAVYLDDVPALPNELHGAFVQSTEANARISSIDTTEAMKLPGVVTFVNAQDIPGKNSFVVMMQRFPDPVFAEERTAYAGQPLGLVVARDRDTAVRAAKMVTVHYEDVRKPILTIKDAIHQNRSSVAANFFTGKAESLTLGDTEGALTAAPHTLKGELSIGSQYHLNMEAHAARVIPTEDGCDVFCTTQWPTETQSTTAQVLGIPANNINVSVKRIGGGYGSKISRQHIVSGAAAVAAWKTKQPVRLVVDLNTNMTYAGWREPYYAQYEVGLDDYGKISALKMDLTSDAGHVANEPSVASLGTALQSAYYIPNLTFTPHIVTTDTAANTWCRTPGHVEAIAAIENVMEHVASYLKKDPHHVRMANMVPPQVPRLLAPPHERNVVKEDIMPMLLQEAEVHARMAAVADFNRSNRWKKRGLSVVPLWYGFDYPSLFRYGMQVAIYEHDGTVAVSHGGIEMGQGINTKVAQVVAYTLGVPLDQVVIKASDTMVGANSFVTGGSFGTDLCAHGVRKASAALRERMDVVKEKIEKETGKSPTWLELVKKCHGEDVDLCERYWTAGKEHPERYDIWGGCCLEVEVDVLTGVYMIRRVDLIEDCGRSMSPYVDVGQVEGSFIMGLGLFTSELVKFDPQSGQKLSNGTWEYKPPTALDIPVDFRVTLLPNSKNPHGVLGAKATGEPPLCLAYAVVTALRQAITSFRADHGDDSWFQMDTPITVEKVQQLCGVKPKQFDLYAAKSADADARGSSPLVRISQWMPGRRFL